MSIHGVRQANQPLELIWTVMLSRPDRPNDVGELLEVIPFDSQSVFLEERDHPFLELDGAVDHEDLYCAPRALGADVAAPEESSELLEDRAVVLVLADLERWLDMPAWRMASEDSRNRDRCLRFIFSVMRAISVRP